MTPPVARHILNRLALLALGLAVWATCQQAAAASSGCPQAQFTPGDDKTWVRFMGIASDQYVYAVIAKRRNADTQDWDIIVPDTETGEPRYQTTLAGGWLYLVITPVELPKLSNQRIAIPPPAEQNTRGAGSLHGLATRWLEPDTLSGLENLPQGARVCSAEW